MESIPGMLLRQILTHLPMDEEETAYFDQLLETNYWDNSDVLHILQLSTNTGMNLLSREDMNCKSSFKRKRE